LLSRSFFILKNNMHNKLSSLRHQNIACGRVICQ